MMAQGSPLNFQSGSVLTQQDRTSLEAMRARIDFLLSNSTAVGQQQQQQQQQHIGSETFEATSEAAPMPLPMPTPMAGVQEVPEIAMDDALADDNTTDQTVPENNEVMSLVSDNGENEDEDPPPITTPLDAADEELNSAVWPVEHHSSISDPDGSNGALQTAAAKPELAATGITSFSLCEHDHDLNHDHDHAHDRAHDNEKGLLPADGQKTTESARGDNTSPPLASSGMSLDTTVGGDDKENEAVAERLDKKSEQQDGVVVSVKSHPETNNSAVDE